MFKILCSSLLLWSAASRVGYAQPSQGAIADPMEQVTSVSQLSDVQPTDWAFGALQSLVERYGCIAGYPDGTFRGNRALTRYEFAAGLNACLERIDELIAAAVGEAIDKEDLATLQKLQEEFSAEIATLRGRIDALESRTAELQANQFSTTTKLNGEIIFALAGAVGENAADRDDDSDNNPDLQEETIFSDRVRLNFDTSFTGKDRLRTRLLARNIPRFDSSVTGTRMTRLGFDGNKDNTFELARLQYRFRLGDKTTVLIDANDGDFHDNLNTLNPLLEGSGDGAISRFGRYNPIYAQGGGAGISTVYKFSKIFSLSLGYLAELANIPRSKAGLFDGPFGAIAQLNIDPSERVRLGLTYVRSYNRDTGGGTGSSLAGQPFGDVATAANSYGVEASFQITKGFTLSGWAGLTDAEAKAGPNAGDRATIFNWAATFAFPDLGKKGNMAGIVVGMPPKVTDSDASKDPDTSLHLEGLYRFQVNDNITITPGLLMITNPEHNDSNDTIFLGTIRTTFKF